LGNRPLVQFATELLQGVRSHRKDIDLLLSKNAANWSLKRMSAIDRNILRIAAYEMFFGSVPGRVAINEAVDIAKRYGSRNSGQFVNGLLDRLFKEREAPAE
jgi:N utilization substance protein B